MKTAGAVCVAVYFLTLFSPSTSQCTCTVFYIQNIQTGLVVTYEPSTVSIGGFEPEGLPQQLWEYKNEMLYNTYNNLALSTGPVLENTCVLLLRNTTGTSATDGQKWTFMADDSIRSLSGFTLALYDYKDGKTNQMLGYSDVDKPVENELFKIVPAIV